MLDGEPGNLEDRRCKCGRILDGDADYCFFCGRPAFLAAVVAVALALVLPAVAGAGVVMRGAGSGGGLASAYGPGLYGNRLACGGVLRPSTRGVASLSHKCGAALLICYRSRCARGRVVDRGPYVRGRSLDLTEALVRSLGFRSARHWGVRYVRWSSSR